MDYPKVVMEAMIRLCFPTPFQRNHSVIDIGGFDFKVDGINIPFDFDAAAYSILETANDFKMITISFYTGTGPFFNDCHLSDAYDQEYMENGLERSSLTASFLSRTSEISEFFTGAEVNGQECSPLVELLEVILLDGNCEYPIAQNVLNKFNAQQKLHYEMSQ